MAALKKNRWASYLIFLLATSFLLSGPNPGGKISSGNNGSTAEARHCRDHGPATPPRSRARVEPGSLRRLV